MQIKSEASVLSRIKAWRELFGEPLANGRSNPDNDMWFLFLDAEECISGLQRYARSVEKALESIQSKCGGCITPSEHSEAMEGVLTALKAAASSAGFQYMLSETRDQINAALALTPPKPSSYADGKHRNPS